VMPTDEHSIMDEILAAARVIAVVGLSS